MTYTYTPRGVCSRKMTVELENGVIKRTRWPTRWRKLWPRRPKRHDYGDLFSASLSPDGYGGAL